MSPLINKTGHVYGFQLDWIYKYLFYAHVFKNKPQVRSVKELYPVKEMRKSSDGWGKSVWTFEEQNEENNQLGCVNGYPSHQFIFRDLTTT